MSGDYAVEVLAASAQHPIWIETETDLEGYCKQWEKLPMIALDTEFMRETSFYPIPGLIQLADDRACYLIDPMRIQNMQPLIDLLINVNVVKVLHACSEDLELFRYHYSVLPNPVLDTQIAAGFAGVGVNMSLQKLLEACLDIHIEKAHTRSNWLQRPLSADQLHYAALDVAYLPELTKRLTSTLQNKKRFEWMMEECRFMTVHSRDQDKDIEKYYLRFTQMRNDSVEQLAALRDLATWREMTCRERNLCRPRVLRNESIIAIVEKWPSTVSQLAELHELRSDILKRDAETILSILNNAKVSAQQNPPLPIVLPAHVYQSSVLKKLQKKAKQIAKNLNMAPEILCKKKDIEKLMNSKRIHGYYCLPPVLSGWRKELVGDGLLQLLEDLTKEEAL